MQLGRFNVSTLRPAVINSIRPSVSGGQFAISTEGGYEVWQTCPLALLRRRSLPGTLALAVLVPATPLIVLQGGGKDPVFPPNKAVIYHDGMGQSIAELEFSERVRGTAVRNGTLCVALRRRVVAFAFGVSGTAPTVKGKEKSTGGFYLRKLGEWETAENEQGLMAISTSPMSTLLALPGRQPGHVQLVSLPPCPPTTTGATRTITYRSPIILAHTHPLSSLTCTSDGSHLITTSERGTLLRLWDTHSGILIRELRRGVDRAEMWGTGFEPSPPTLEGGKKNKRNIVGWSDKGTIHIWTPHSPSTTLKTTPSITKLLSRNLPLPNYFSSIASFAHYRLPRKNPHAFAAVMSATAGRAGVSSAKMDETEDEWAERFVVIWVSVVVPISSDDTPKGTNSGTREGRRSFGSGTTSRTATPTPVRNERPTSSRRTSSYTESARRAGSTPKPGSKLPTPGAEKTRTEWQLVAITFSGDWYRLRIPPMDETDEKKRGKCELVEYRRLGVGGAGW